MVKERLGEGLEENLAEGLYQSLHMNQHQCLETVVRQNQMTCVCQCSLFEFWPCLNLTFCLPHELDLW